MRMETPAEKTRREDHLRHALADREATIRRISNVEDHILALETDRKALYADLEDDHNSVSRYTRTQ